MNMLTWWVFGSVQKLSFYDIVRDRRVVDLPGYGFAFTDDKRQELWEQTVGWGGRVDWAQLMCGCNWG